jgi:hypothetical protein
MANTLPRVELKLNEENELSFRLSIEGGAALDSKPIYRFVMTETDTDRGWVFPGQQEGDSLVNVCIPSLKETFSPQKRYVGKLEVIVGSHYFNPTEILLQFNQPFSVSGVSVSKKSTTKSKPLPTIVKEDSDSPKVISKMLTKTVPPSPAEDDDMENIQATPDDDDTILFDLDSVISQDTPPQASRTFPKSSKPITPGEAQAFSKVLFTEPPHASPEVQTASPDVDPKKLLPSAQNKKDLAEHARMKIHLKNQMKKALLSEKKQVLKKPTNTAPSHSGQNLKNLMDSLSDDDD